MSVTAGRYARFGGKGKRLTGGVCFGRLASPHQHCGDVGQRPVGHLFGKLHDNPTLNLFMQMLAQFAERFRRRDDGKRLEISTQCAMAQLFSRLGSKTVFLELMKVGFVDRRPTISAALRGQAGAVGLDIAVLAILSLFVRFGHKVDLRSLALVAEEKHLGTIGNKDERVMR
jgi:hypothetical protein